MRNLIIAIVASILFTISGTAGELKFSDGVKASIVFRGDHSATRHYPNVLKVFLRLENIHDAEVSWVADYVTDIEAELLDKHGKPVPQAPAATSIGSNSRPFSLPYGSNLEWLISHGGVSMMSDATNQYALIVGGRGWLIPIETVDSYTLRIRLRGQPWTSELPKDVSIQPAILLDLPPAKINISPQPAKQTQATRRE